MTYDTPPRAFIVSRVAVGAALGSLTTAIGIFAVLLLTLHRTEKDHRLECVQIAQREPARSTPGAYLAPAAASERRPVLYCKEVLP